jgi:hypothetical protein
MADITLQKTDIPFWFSGDGTLDVRVGVSDPTQPLPASDQDLLSVSFKTSGSKPLTVGGLDSFKFGIGAESAVALTPLWASSSAERLKRLDDYGLAGYFGAGADHSERVLLLFTVGASADADVQAKFKYWDLTASAELKAGADGRYALIRSYPNDTPAGDMVRDILRALRLPANVERAPAEDELISFEYGGYVNFKGSVGVGYEIGGAPSFEINQLNFVEKYKLNLMASLGLESRLAGQFKIEVRRGTRDGWAHVVLRKSRSKFFSVAADVSVLGDLEQEGLPESADDFLSAVIGLKSKNWLNLFQQVKDLSDFGRLEAYLDKLAQSFVEQYTGRAFDALADNAKLDEALGLIRRAADEYDEIGDRAVALFDKYFDAAAGALDRRLSDALDFIEGLTSLDQLKGHVDPVVWDVVNHLTDGDPLSWLLGKVEVGGQTLNSLDELKGRAGKAVALVREDANKEIRSLIELAKSQFPLDKFIRDLDGLDWVKLKGLADKRLVGFVERLTGVTVDKLSNGELGKVVSRFHEVLLAVDGFKNTLYDKIKGALTQTFSFKLHAAYSRATENEALMDFELDLTTPRGKELMKRAGQGDFGGVPAAYDSGVVLLNEGLLTHKVTRESSLSVNIVGWHLGWHYQGIDRLITEAEQRILTDEGQLTIVTTMSVQKERERRRNGERVYTNFLLRFIGESRGVLETDARNGSFLVDIIKRMSSSYELVFDDPGTTEQELAQYLSFADDFGLASSDEAAEEALEPLLPTDAQGNFGDISVTYKARFSEEGLGTLFRKPFGAADEAFIRKTLRLLVLAGYVNKPFLPARGWSYWTPGVRALWAQEGAQFRNHSSRKFSIIAPSPFKNLQAPPGGVTLDRTELGQLSTLYNIEESVVKGMRKLSALVQSQQKLSPRDFEKALADFGAALKNYDDFDEGTNTVFAVFDRLIQRESAGRPYRNSSLELKSKLDGRTVTKMLIA